MNSELSLYNLVVWIAQVFMITSIGALLPFLFRIEHPRSNLLYFRVLLVVALLLPLIQPIHHEIVILRDAPQASTLSAASSTAATPQLSMVRQWQDLILVLLVTGFVVRIVWLTGGLWQLRRLKTSSMALYPVPESVQTATTVTKTSALFCISHTIQGPVTFGFFRPVVLLPASFPDMPAEAQRNVACHELLHVRRKDWLLTMLEEFIASVLWFQPAVWWLIAETRLAREQIVDAAVVSLTATRESYITTLFSLAKTKWGADFSVAPLFLRRRHLIQRVHALLTEVSMSRMRLLSSYCSMAVILAIAGGSIFVSLPLIGQAEVRRAPAQEPSSPPAQNAPGYVVHRIPISYPLAAQQKRIEGTVVVELTFNASGEIVDSRVLSGPEELRQVALQTAIQGKYPIDIERTLQVVMDFKLPRGLPRPASPQTRNPAVPTELAQLTGSVSDPSRNLLPGVTVTATNTEDTKGVAVVALTDAKGEYKFSLLPAGKYRLSADLTGFQTSTYNNVPLGLSQQVRLNFMLQPGLPATASPQDANLQPANRVRVGGNVIAANLIHQVKPEYPAQAKEYRIQGVVVLQAGINKNGSVDSLTVVTGHPLLTQAAIDAVKQWVYQPVVIDGQAVDVLTTITVNFAYQD